MFTISPLEVVMEVEDKSRETTMNNLLCEEDGKRFDMLRKLSSGEPNLQDFYQFVMYASQTGCNVLKRVGKNNMISDINFSTLYLTFISTHQE